VSDSHKPVPVHMPMMGPRKFDFEFRCGTDGCGHILAGVTHLVIVNTTGLEVRCRECKAFYLVVADKVYGPLREDQMGQAMEEQAKRVVRKGMSDDQ
jgi:hypothetical protein